MPLKNESEPITDEEFLYRRVHYERFRTGRVPYVSPGAFEPRTGGLQPDVDGISLFRADCLNNPNEILALIPDLKKRAANGIVAVKVDEVKQSGLTIVSTRRDDIVGHVSIPELSAAAMSDPEQRKKCKEQMFELAELASLSDRIVLESEPMNPRE